MAFDGTPPIGHNNPPVTKAEFINAIEHWTRTRRVADALTAEELGQMQAFDRIDAQRKGLILGLSRYYETHRSADVTPGVLTLITLFSDNEKGTCTLSQSGMAKMLHRSRQAIVEATTRLAKDGLTIPLGKPGRTSEFLPVIPKAVACRNHMVWLAEAIKGGCTGTTSDTCKAGVTCKTEPTCQTGVTGCTGTTHDTCKVSPPEPVRQGLHNFTTDFTAVEEVKDSPCAQSCSGDVSQPSKEGFPSAEQLKTWYETSKRWGCPPDVRNPTHVHRWKTNADIRSAVAVLGREFSQSVIEQALFATLAEMEARTFDPLTPKSKIGAGPCLAYFNKAFPGKLSEFRKREHDDRVDAKTVEAQAELRVKGTAERTAAYGQAARGRIEASAPAPRGTWQIASAQPAQVAPGRFPDAWKVPGMALVGLTGRHLNRIFEEVPGATLDDIERASEKEKPQTREKQARTVEDILRAIGGTVRYRIRERAEKALTDKFGMPKALCGGTPHREFKRKWACLSEEKLAEIAAKAPDIGVGGYSMKCRIGEWLDDLAGEFANHDDYGTGMQARVESEIEQRILAEQADIVNARQKRECEAEERRADAEPVRTKRVPSIPAQEPEALVELRHQLVLVGTVDDANAVWDSLAERLTFAGREMFMRAQEAYQACVNSIAGGAVA